MRILKKLIPFLRPHRTTILATIVLGLIVNGLWLGTAKLVKVIVDQILQQKDEKMLYQAPLIIVALMAVNGVCRFLHIFFLRYTGEKVAVQIRSAVHNKFLNLGLDYHGGQQSGALISRTVNDVNTIQQGLSLFADVVKEPINVLMIVGYLIYVDWKLTLFSMLIVPVVAFFSDRLGRVVRRYSFRMQENFEEFTSVLKESLDGIRVVKAFTLENKLKQKIQNINQSYLAIRRQILSREEFSGPFFEFIAALLASCILVYTGSQVIKGYLTAGDVMSFFYALGLIQTPVKKLQDANVRIQHTIASTERVFAILDYPISLVDPVSPKKFPEAWQSIEFKNVEFGYGARHVIKNLNLSVNRGEVLAIVGSSGSGKSTLVNLIPRFFDPIQGQVLIGGVPLKDMALNDLRRHIALVTQDVFLFNESIEDNILGASNPIVHSATEHTHHIVGTNVKGVAEAAHALDFILRTPEGFETKVGDRGLNLSGGERQRISIARALYKNSPILILDEATSSLDSESEQEVQKALDKLMEGRTTFVIAHRLSTVQKADRIIVMKNGEIIEVGNHTQLLEKKGEYQKLHAMQFKM